MRARSPRSVPSMPPQQGTGRDVRVPGIEQGQVASVASAGVLAKVKLSARPVGPAAPGQEPGSVALAEI
jgi:hypothetical protein